MGKVGSFAYDGGDASGFWGFVTIVAGALFALSLI